jgi:two-component system, OmpR family, heavy metal sensor histidine kinase CusS
MFLKNVKLDFLKIGSIRTRLTVLYTLTALILLLTIAGFLYWETINILYKADYQFLSDEVDTIQYILNNNKTDLTALKKVAIDMPLNTDSSIYRYFVRVINDEDQVMIETPGIDAVVKDHKDASMKLLGKKRYWYYSVHASNYLLIKAPINLGNGKLGSIQIVLDLSHQHDVISDRKILIISILALTICALILGFYISHKGTQSLYEITETAKEITISSLHRRIDPKHWPKELRELGTAFNQMLDRIQASYLRLNQFSADLAHELRTPIGNLIGETEVSLSYSHNVDEYRNVLESNLEELHRISQLIENILFLARAENPERVIQKKLLNIQEEIAIVCEFYQAMADEKNIKITYEGTGSLYANSVMIRRMISNIISNSLNYTLPDGLIHFKMTTTNDGVLQIIASDNGIGILVEHLPKIFDRFYRVDSARSQFSGGTGLGLAIVKSIVELHQGTVSITSAPEKGTTIFLVFPK